MSGLSLAALISPRRRTTPTPPQQANSSSQGEGGDVELGGSRGGGGRVSSGESAASAQAHLDAPTPATNENGQPTPQTPSPEQNSEAARDAAEQALVDESLAQPLTWSRKEALPSGVWDLELLDDSDDSGNDDEDDIDSSARRESSGAALSPLVCLSALNFGGVLPMAVALGFPLGPLVLPDPATAEQPSPVWWLLALLALPACFFGFFDLQSRPAFDVLARSLEFYQVIVAFLASAASLTGFSPSYSRPAAPWLPWAILQAMCICAATLGPDALRRALLARARQHVAYRDRLLEQLRARALPPPHSLSATAGASRSSSAEGLDSLVPPPPPPPLSTSVELTPSSRALAAHAATEALEAAALAERFARDAAAADAAAQVALCSAEAHGAWACGARLWAPVLRLASFLGFMTTGSAAVVGWCLTYFDSTSSSTGSHDTLGKSNSNGSENVNGSGHGFEELWRVCAPAIVALGLSAALVVVLVAAALCTLVRRLPRHSSSSSSRSTAATFDNSSSSSPSFAVIPDTTRQLSRRISRRLLAGTSFQHPQNNPRSRANSNSNLNNLDNSNTGSNGYRLEQPSPQGTAFPFVALTVPLIAGYVLAVVVPWYALCFALAPVQSPHHALAFVVASAGSDGTQQDADPALALAAWVVWAACVGIGISGVALLLHLTLRAVFRRGLLLAGLTPFLQAQRAVARSSAIAGSAGAPDGRADGTEVPPPGASFVVPTDGLDASGRRGARTAAAAGGGAGGSTAVATTSEGFGWRHHHAAYPLSSLLLPFALHALVTLPVFAAALALSRAASAMLRVSSSTSSGAEGHNGSSDSREDLLLPGCPALLTVLEVDLLNCACAAILYLIVGLLELSRLPSKHLHRIGRLMKGVAILTVLVRFLLMVAMRGACNFHDLVDLGHGRSSSSSSISSSKQKVAGAAVVLALSVSTLGFFASVGAVGLWALRMAGAAKLEGPIATGLGFPTAYFTSHASRRCGKVVGWHAVMLLAHAPFTLPLDAAAHWLSPTSAHAKTHSSNGTSNFFGLNVGDTTTWEAALGGAVSAPALASLSTVLLLMASVYVALRGRLLGPPRLPDWFQHAAIILGLKSGRNDTSSLAELHARKLKPAWAAPALLLVTALCTAAAIALLLASSIVFWAKSGADALVTTSGNVDYGDDNSTGDDNASSYGTGGGNGNVAAWLTMVSAALRLICVNLWLQLRYDSGSFGSAALVISISNAHIAQHLSSSTSSSSSPVPSSPPSLRSAPATPQTYPDASLLRDYLSTPRRMSQPPAQSIVTGESGEQLRRRRGESIDRAPANLIESSVETPARSNSASADAPSSVETPDTTSNDSQDNSIIAFDPVSDLASAPVTAPAPISAPAPTSTAAAAASAAAIGAQPPEATTAPSRVPPMLTAASNLGRWMRRRAVGGRRFQHGWQGSSSDSSGNNGLEQFEWVRDLDDDGEVVWVPIHERRLRPLHSPTTVDYDSGIVDRNEPANNAPPLTTNVPTDNAVTLDTRPGTVTRDLDANVDDGDALANLITATHSSSAASDQLAATTLSSTSIEATQLTRGAVFGTEVAAVTHVKDDAPKKSSRATGNVYNEPKNPATPSTNVSSPNPRKSRPKSSHRRSSRSPKGTALDKANKPKESTPAAPAGPAIVDQVLTDVLNSVVTASDDRSSISSKCSSGQSDCKEDYDEEEQTDVPQILDAAVNSSGLGFVNNANDMGNEGHAKPARLDGSFMQQQKGSMLPRDTVDDSSGGGSGGSCVGLTVRVLPPFGGAVAWTDGWMLSAEATLAVRTKSLVFRGGIEIGAVPALYVPTHELASVTLRSFEEKRDWFISKCQQLKVPWRGGHQEVSVRRSHLIVDSIKALSLRSPRQFRELWRFKYEGELGIDSGGVSREWWESLVGALLDPSTGLFEHAATDNLSYQINAAGAEVRLAQAQESNARKAKAHMAAAAQAESEHATKQTKAAAVDTSAITAAVDESQSASEKGASHCNGLESGNGAEAGSNHLNGETRSNSGNININHGIASGSHAWMGSELAGLEAYRFVGRLLGKALLDQQTVPAYLCRPLFKHVLGWPVGLPDLEFTDASLHQTLTWLLDPNNRDVASELDIVFAVDEPNPFAGSSSGGGGASSSGSSASGGEAMRTRALVPGGENVPLRASNLKQFVILRFKDAMQTKPGHSAALGSFLAGWYEVLPLGLMSPFTPAELELLLCGVATLDVEEWRKATVYVGGYSAASPTIVAFWACMEALPDAGRSRVLQFVTGTSRLPAGGFRALQGNDGEIRHFTIDRVPANHLPRAHTCFNRLDLPAITNAAALQSMLQHLLLADLDGFNIA